MGNSIRKNLPTLIIVLATIILAGIAIFTAIRLYQLRQSPVAPNVPSSIPQAATPSAACSLTFTINSQTSTPTATPTATPVPQCNSSCTTNSDCPSSMICYVGSCRNPSCSTTNTCLCQTATPTATSTPTSTPTTPGTSTPAPTSTPNLPSAGNIEPTILGISAGAILLALSIALIL